MKFVKYPSITNSFKGDSIDFIKLNHAKDLEKVSWHVSEKVHGANFSIWTDGKTVEYASRNGFITEQQRFYSFQPVAKKYIANVAMVQTMVKRPIAIFGELFGGVYNGNNTGSKPVQKEVQYCPHIDFCIFDIATINGDDTLAYLDEAELHDLVFASGIPIAPYIGEYASLDEAMLVDNKFLTRMPILYNLPPIENNLCEGVVIKPSKPLFTSAGERIIFKNKNDKFKESNSVEVSQSLNNEFILFFNELKSHITQSRFNNVLSKLGNDKLPPDYFRAFLEDCLDECKEIRYNMFSDQQKKFLNKAVGRYIWPIIKSTLYAKNNDLSIKELIYAV